MKTIRVLIVDDSPLIRSVLSSILCAEKDIEVIGEAADPFEAKDWILKNPPDVVTLDVEMPRMDGITFLKRIMSFRPVPVIMISSYTYENSVRTLEALAAGAVDFVAKPTSDIKETMEALGWEIVSKVRAAAGARVKPGFVRPAPEAVAKKRPKGRLYKILAIGASTGGTQAVEKVLNGLTAVTNGILIVQHMPVRYTASFAQRLNNLTHLDVVEATDRMRLAKDKALVAPGDKHMRLVPDGAGYKVRLDTGPLVNHQRPSVDVLFSSVAQNAGRDAVGIVLTGMGEDGAKGLLEMRQAGSLTIAQDEATSVVFGMPRAAIEIGAAARVAPLSDIPELIVSASRKKQP